MQPDFTQALKQVEDAMNQHFRRKPEGDNLNERAEKYFAEELQEYLDNAGDILEAIGEAGDNFVKGLLKHPDIREMVVDYFEDHAWEKALKRAEAERE